MQQVNTIQIGYSHLGKKEGTLVHTTFTYGQFAHPLHTPTPNKPNLTYPDEYTYVDM